MVSGSSGSNNQELQNLDDQDRRYFPRWEVENRVVCLVDEKNVVECRSRDLNCTGASIYSDADFVPDKKIKMTIYLDDNVSVDVEGKVLWSHPNKTKHVVGINFEQTSKKAQDLILKYAFEVNRDELTKHWFKGWNGKK